MITLWQDIKYAFRQFNKNPGFTIVVVLVLALGIGANSAIFSVFNAVLLRPLPFDESDRLVTIWQTDKTEGDRRQIVSYPNVEDWRRDNQVFEDIAVFRDRSHTLLADEGAMKIEGVSVSASFFPLLRVKAMLGRTFIPDEDKPGSGDIVVLSHGFWRRHCEGNSKVIGETLQLHERSYQIVGVLPPLRFPGDTLGKAELFTPISREAFAFNQRGACCFFSLARLKGGVSLVEAQNQMDVIAARLESLHEANEDTGVQISTLHSDLVRDVHLALWVLFGAVGFVLMIACANVANLLTIRACIRTREFAIRSALGAGRYRLIRQTLIESLILSFIGSAMGLLLAYWGIHFIKTIVPGDIPRLDEISLDSNVVRFTILMAVITGILFGLAPALRNSSLRTFGTLKESALGTAGAQHNTFRNVLVVGEIAVAMMLLIGATLLIRSVLELMHVDPGFRAKRVLTWQISLPGSAYRESEDRRAFYKQFMERLRTTPGILSVGATSTLPFAEDVGVGIKRLDGFGGVKDEYLGTRYNSITPDYFEAMGIPLRQGRLFSEIDTVGKKGSVIINETMARLYFPNEDPIGQRIYCGLRMGADEADSYEIVGIVGDTKQMGLDVQTEAEMFLPFTQQTWNTMTFAAHIEENPLAMVNSIRTLIHKHNRDVLVERFRTMNQWTADSIARRRFVMILIGLFAGLALCLTIVGIYGVIAYSTTQRTHEIGIRKALGAGALDVVLMILRNGIKLALLGIGIGILGAVILSRYLQSMLFEITTTDPVTYGIVCILYIVVSLLACFIPARRAAKTNPMEALRYE